MSDERDDDQLDTLARQVDEGLTLSLAAEFANARDAQDALAPEALFGLDDAALRRVVALTLAAADVARPVEVSLLITDDAGIRTLNREYRARDEATDVLSFPLLDAPLVVAPPDQLWQPAQSDLTLEDVTLDQAIVFGALGEAPDGALADDEDDEDADDEDDADGEDDADDADDIVNAPFDDHVSLEDTPLHLGDIALSRETLARQAAQAGHRPAWELAYLVAHGVLHLVGYDDQTEAGYAAMVALQARALAHAQIAR